MSSFPVTEAQIVALFMECIVYGIYLVTLWITARALFFDALGERKKVNWPMVAVMSLMAVFATLDVALGLKHNLDAFIFYSGPGGPQEEFEDISYWVNVMKTVDTQMMALIGDAMLIYRAFVVFSYSWLIIIAPVVMWLADAACSIVIIWLTATIKQDSTISTQGLLKPFLYSFLCITIALNLLTTALIVQKIWRTNKKSAPYITRSNGQQQRPSRAPRTKLENVIRIILESGMLYTVTVLATFICELAGSNAVYGVSDVMVITVGISFNLIIIRVDQASTSSEFSITPSNNHGSFVGFPLRFLRSSMGGANERSQRGVEITITRDVAFDHDLESADDKTRQTVTDVDTENEGEGEGEGEEGKGKTKWTVAV